MKVHFAVQDRKFRPGEHQTQCSFCLRERAEIPRLVAALAVSICLDCTTRCGKELARARPENETIYRSDARSCSFCSGKSSSEKTIFAEHACICAPCVQLAADVFVEGMKRDEYDDRIDELLRDE